MCVCVYVCFFSFLFLGGTDLFCFILYFEVDYVFGCAAWLLDLSMQFQPYKAVTVNQPCFFFFFPKSPRVQVLYAHSGVHVMHKNVLLRIIMMVAVVAGCEDLQLISIVNKYNSGKNGATSFGVPVCSSRGCGLSRR